MTDFGLPEWGAVIAAVVTIVAMAVVPYNRAKVLGVAGGVCLLAGLFSGYFLAVRRVAYSRSRSRSP